MKIDWSTLDAALERRAPVLWWRDDDVTEPSPALDRLLDLTAAWDAPITLAAIPTRIDPALAPRIAHDPSVSVAVHGWTHTSHAPKDEKKAEFGAHRPLSDRMAEAEKALSILTDSFGAQAVPVFIPPWNRIAPDMPATLALAGYRGISVYGERMPRHLPLSRFDAHLDPIDWRSTRSAVDPQGFVERIATLMNDDAPIGLMTHHLAHDDAIWELTDAVVTRLTHGGAIWTSLPSLIDDAQSDASGL